MTGVDSPLVHPLDHLALTVAVLLLVACLALTLPVFIGRRRRQSTDAVAWADRMRRDPAASWGADRALRALVAACARERVGFPGIARASIGTTVRMDLAAPTVAPPAPWTSTPDGRSWSAPMWALQALPLDDAGADRFATVVAVGTDDAGTVLLDLSRAHGLVALRGDRGAREAVARRIADQTRTNPWSVATPVLAVGVGADVLGPTTAVSVADAVAAVREDTAPGVVVFADAPRGAQATALAAALERPGNRWGVVVLGRAAHPRWELTADRDGVVTSDVLGRFRWIDIALSEPRETPVETGDNDTDPAGDRTAVRPADRAAAGATDRATRSAARAARDRTRA